MNAVPVAHAFGCTAGWTALVDQSGPAGVNHREPTTVTLLCWACGHVVVYTAVTDTSEESTTGVPAAHRPFLRRRRSWTGRFPAAIEPERIPGRPGYYLHAERALGVFDGPRDIFAWLVTDAAGNVLGEVWHYLGPQRGDVFRWGTPDIAGALASGQGYHRRAAAAKDLLAAVLPDP